MTPSTDSHFQHALRVVLGIEGGFSDDARDAGGATKYGISLRFARQLARMDSPRWKAHLDRDGDGDVDAADMQQLPKSVAIEIYYEEFWREQQCAALPWPVSMMHFGYVVNMPPSAAGRILQRAIYYAGQPGIVIDGVPGPQTIRLARLCDVALLCTRMEAAASEHYADLGDRQPYYEQGWQWRSADFLWKAALHYYQAASIGGTLPRTKLP